MRFANPLTLVLAAGLLSGAAHAPLLPPPPPAGDPEPAYTPPPPPAPRAAPQERPQRPQQANPARRQGAGQRVRDIPELPYAPLACPIASIPGCLEYDGPPALYDRSMHIMALTRNPTTTNSVINPVTSLLAKRRVEQLEPAIIEHLEIVLEIRDGLLDTIGIGDLRELQATTQRLQPLVAQPPLTTALEEGGFISRVMGRWNLRVISEYQRALGEWWQENEPDQASDLLLQHVMKDSVAEAMEAYDALLLELAMRPDAVTDRVELPSNVARTLRGLRTAPETLTTTGARNELTSRVGLALRTVDTDTLRSILSAVIDTRPDAATALVVPITVEYEGKEVTETRPVEVRKFGPDEVPTPNSRIREDQSQNQP